MSKISIDILKGVLLDAGLSEASTASIVDKCLAIMEGEEKEKAPKQESDGHIVLVKDPNGVISDKASALILKKVSCIKTIQGEPTDPCLWGIDELDYRIYQWIQDSSYQKYSLRVNYTFGDILKKYPKKLAKPYGFSFVEKEAVPVLSTKPDSIMNTMFNFNPIVK